MRTEDVLAATGTGIWRWNNASGQVTLDAKAAELLGLPPERITATESAVRARFHVVDFVELGGIVTLAVAEGRIAEARLRVVAGDGTALRTVRVRLHPHPNGDSDHVPGSPYVLVGTVSEVPEPSPAQTPVTGDWRRSREAFLLDAGRALAEARSTAEVLRVAATLSMPGFSPAGLAVFGLEGDRLSVIGHHGHEPGSEDPFLDMPLHTSYPAADVVRTGRAIYLTSPEEYQRRYPATWSLAEPFGRQSWAFLPLIVAGRTIGAWMASFGYRVAFTPDERSVLTTVARMLAQALSRAYLHESERELTEGLQRTMRPAHKPDIKGLSIAARYIPTGGGLQVGGDWYDVIPLPSGRTALVIGDVQGHDVRAAGIMAQLRIALRAYAAEGHRPDAVLSRASRFLAGMGAASVSDPDGDPDCSDERFATCLYIEADPVTGTLDIARAGHHDPATRLADGTLLVRPTAGGLPLGIETDDDYPTTRLVLEPGETLLACTDGLIETGGHDVETGWARIREVFGARPEAKVEELADALVQAVHGPPSHHMTGPLADRREDDIALLLLSRDTGLLAETITARRTVSTIAQADAARIAEARHQLQELLYDWMVEDQVDGAVLMLSEMLTNVLVHTEGDALMVAEITGDRGARRLRVDVADKSDELPHRRHPGELASSGRGLILMDLLAGAWGVDPRGEGKSIWFEIREDSPPPVWG
ncbi:ATP-binding SpoIIE family protein phosphatase [Streptomyces gobiensis]|uniref:ATP-binding SpoIIE family protein phosphatase n=1 Tax=Streptomyces gobiensis TaxID=2875706 RepID=UPI001E35596B|nr:SpoIIE family protein phosphatase [Streptomyces gobiensis]UGY92661.1 SpoIIE family protein phosphatase [Streptomyces gobiensis]